jgi:hypothetical protein
MPIYLKEKLNQYHWILILFSPFMFLIYSLRNLSADIKFKAAFIFCVFFGVCFMTTSDGLDSYRHLQEFKLSEFKGYELLQDHFQGLLKGEADPELYVPLVNFFLSRFTMSGSVLFGFHAMVYAFFYIGSIRLVYEKMGSISNKLTLGLFLMLVFLFPIHQINGVRWFIAMWCFVYCALRYFNGEKRFLLYAFGAGLIHFSLYLAPVFLIISIVIGFRPKILVVIALLSFAIPRLQGDSIVGNKEEIGIESIEGRTESYTHDTNVEQRMEGLAKVNWYVTFRYDAILYFMVAMSLVYLFCEFKGVKSLFIEKIYTFLFLWGSFVNYSFNIPSFGGRMRFLFWIMLAIFFVIELSSKRIRFAKELGWFAMGAILIYALVDFRAYSDWVSAQILFTPLSLFFTDPLPITLNKLVFFWE